MKKTSTLATFLSLVCSIAGAQGLADYDAAVEGSGHVAALTESVSFDGTNGAEFDFGAVSGDATIEFIVSGDPVAGERNGFLGRGEDTTFSLRYEQWDDTGQLGFTHGGVADYVFDPPLASPEVPTHVTYRFDSAAENMDIFLNGGLAGSVSAPGFAMPSGPGLIGNVQLDGGEGMVGTIDRITVYDSALDPAVIGSHAAAFVPEPSGILLIMLGALAVGMTRLRRK